MLPPREQPRVPCSNKIDCYRCGADHPASQCPQKPPTSRLAARRQDRVFTVDFVINEDEGLSEEQQPKNAVSPEVFAEVNNMPANCLVDFGAFLSVISQTLVEYLNLVDEVNTGNKCFVRK